MGEGVLNSYGKSLIKRRKELGNMESTSLAPAYDMISTVIYESATKDMSFHIGGIRDLGSIDEDKFKFLASDIGIAERILLARKKVL